MVNTAPRDVGTFLTLKWTPIEYIDAALAMFNRQMSSMTGGWGGRFDKLQEWLATWKITHSKAGDEPRCLWFP